MGGTLPMKTKVLEHYPLAIVHSYQQNKDLFEVMLEPDVPALAAKFYGDTEDRAWDNAWSFIQYWEHPDEE